MAICAGCAPARTELRRLTTKVARLTRPASADNRAMPTTRRRRYPACNAICSTVVFYVINVLFTKLITNFVIEPGQRKMRLGWERNSFNFTPYVRVQYPLTY